jgi:hypothetical protein
MTFGVKSLQRRQAFQPTVFATGFTNGFDDLCLLMDL